MATKALAEAYAACARITRREAKNFYYAFASLPREQRQAVYVLYAFCREADDVVDSASSMDALSTLENGVTVLPGGDLLEDASSKGAAGTLESGVTVLPGGDLLEDASSKGAAGTLENGVTVLPGGDLAEDASSKGAAGTLENGVTVLPGGELAEGAPSMNALSTKGARDETALLLDGRKEDAVASARKGIAKLRERLVAAAEGRATIPRDLALVDVFEKFGVSPEDLADVVAGVEMDLTRARYRTFDDLRDYCYHVASAVGLATLPILNAGVPPTDAMREHAIDLGLGMQLVNILRDVAEDIDRDRVYLPQDDLERFGVDQVAFVRKKMTEPLRLVLAFESARAAEFLERGRQLVPLLPRRGRSCPWLLAEIYGRVLQRIIAADYDVFARRVVLRASEKLILLATARWRAG